MTRFLLALTLLITPTLASAAPIIFDLRDPVIEGFDEVNSFSLTQSGLTATLTALPATYNEPPLRAVVLNQTASSFGINVVDTTCGGLEDSAVIDGGCTGESVSIVFNADVILQSLVISSFGSTDAGKVTIGASTINLLSTGTHSLGNTSLAAGSPWSVAFTAGNGFSFDSFTVTAVPEPASLTLLGVGLLGIGRQVVRRARR